MKKFSDFTKDENFKNSNFRKGNFNGESCNKGGSQKISDNQTAFEMLKKISSKYEGASENQLLSAIFEEAKRARTEGRLNDGEIENFVNTISPMLSSSQKKQLSKIINQIKK